VPGGLKKAEKMSPARFSRKKMSPARFPKEFQNLSKNFKLQNSKIAENHHLDVLTPSTGKRKIVATVDFANPKWYSVIFGVSTNEIY
jgi:hypothetical protein